MLLRHLSSSALVAVGMAIDELLRIHRNGQYGPEFFMHMHKVSGFQDQNFTDTYWVRLDLQGRKNQEDGITYHMTKVS